MKFSKFIKNKIMNKKKEKVMPANLNDFVMCVCKYKLAVVVFVLGMY